MNFHHRRNLYDAEIAGCRASIVGRLLDVREHQHVPTDWQIVLRSQIQGRAFLPFHVRHRGSDGDAGQVQRGAQHHFADSGRRYGETGRNASNCRHRRRRRRSRRESEQNEISFFFFSPFFPLSFLPSFPPFIENGRRSLREREREVGRIGRGRGYYPVPINNAHATRNCREPCI